MRLDTLVARLRAARTRLRRAPGGPLASLATVSFEQGTTLEDGRYELRRRIGSGGMASVWLAQDTRLERPVAIKIPTEGLALDPVFARRFEREARLAASLSHPNLVPVYDFGREGERPFLVMEYIDGESLAEMREREHQVDSATLARALLGALEPIHAAGIVHRDVKPGNVLVEKREGRMLLTDFGIAQAAEATQLTGTGQVIGTLRYIAPEVMNGERASPRSDLYACGVLLGEFLGPDDPPALRRLADELSADDPTARPGSASSALAMVPRPRAGTVEGVSRTTEVVDAAGPIADRDPTPVEPVATEPEPTPAEPVAQPQRSPASVTRSGAAPPPPPPSAPARAATPSSSGSSPGMMPRLILGLVLVLAVGAIAAAVISSGGGDESGDGTSASQQEQQEGPGDKGSGGAAAEEAPAEEAPVEEAATGLPEPASNPNPARGARLNAEGKALFDAGDAAGAVPILERAVAAYPADSTEIEYGYALFNYAQALRVSGQPEAAIPVLERRMLIDDQLDVVQAELELAQQEAGAG